MVVQDQMELEQPEQHEVMEQLLFRVRIVIWGLLPVQPPIQI
jgi:hypothetical protein